MPAAESPRRLIVWGVGITAGAVVLLFLAWVARSALVLIYVAALLAMGMAPLVRVIERASARMLERSIPHWIAPLVIFTGVLAGIAGIALVIVPTFASQTRELTATIPDWFTIAQQWLIDHGVLSEPITLREALENAPGASGDLATDVAVTAWGVMGGIVGAVTLLILTFYLLVESRSLHTGFVRLFPRSRRARAGEVASEIVAQTSAWLGGQLLLSAIIGVSAAVALGLMGVPYFYVLALIAAVGEAIPVVGPLIAAVPAILIALTVSPGLALGVAVFYLVQQQIENNVLVPKIMEHQVGLSAVTVIVALLLGNAWYGAIGAILAVPTAAIVKVVFEALWREEHEEGAGRRRRAA